MNCAALTLRGSTLLICNAELELGCDLVLVNLLLSPSIAETIYLHLKPYSTFVSDAVSDADIQDIHHTLTVLAIE